jgi:putative N6-adenine-specific DNA methylase
MDFIVKTLYGLENILAGELNELGLQSVTVRNRAVTFEGDLESLYTANYMSRVAISVLLKIATFKLTRAEDLYDQAVNTEWSEVMTPDDTFAVVSVSNSPFFSHTGYPALVIKDAIADYFRKRAGRRPSVNTAHPAILINLHISNNDVTLSVDSSVVPLFKRGYRKMQGPAPLNESLAAGLIMLAGWKGEKDFHDPMCGSGTIPVEAGLIASAVPPGYFRDFFGFQNWRTFDQKLFDKVKEKYNSKIKPIGVRISGSDISMQAVRLARESVQNAGLAGEVKITHEDFINSSAAAHDGLILFNPPYGMRINPAQINTLYSSVGTVLKHKYTGSEAWIFSGSPDALKSVGLKPAAKIKLFNGSIECMFCRYMLREGAYGQNRVYPQ